MAPIARPADLLAPGRPAWPLRAGVAATAIATAVLAAWMVTRVPDAPPAEQSEPAPAAATTAPVSPPAPPVDPHPLRIDLRTLRRVWLRVAVDGRIAIEREVAAGEQLPFGADRSIVVRAGDAGAVTLSVGGVDQGPLGGDGQVVTRTFGGAAAR
jgi:hypothetical protein